MWNVVNLTQSVKEGNRKAACSVYNKVECVLPLTLALPPKYLT